MRQNDSNNLFLRTAKAAAAIGVQIAIENDLFLIHNDADYDRIRRVIKFKVF